MKLVVTALLCVTTTAAWAGDAAVTGSLATPDGKAVKNYPVVISGTSPSGETQDWVTTTDEAGKFRVDALPAGKYVVSPGNDPGVARTFEMESQKGIWQLFKKQAPVPTEQNVATIQVTPGSKLRSLTE
jgi:hypothetical protein